MKLRCLSNYADFKLLGKYEFFRTNFYEMENKIYFSLRKDKRTLTWLARPIDSLDKTDMDAGSYLLSGKDGSHGILFRKRDQRFRVVPFNRPLKSISKPRRKFRKKKR